MSPGYRWGMALFVAGCTAPVMAPASNAVLTPPSLPGVVTLPPTTAGQSLPVASQDSCTSDGACISPANLLGPTLKVAVKTTSGEPLAGAMIWVQGSGLAFGPADAVGERTFVNMSPGDYRLRVVAEGYLADESTVSLQAVSPPALGTTQIRIPGLSVQRPLEPASRIQEGIIRDGQGLPIAGARIVSGLQQAETDEKGQYRLALPAAAPVPTVHHVAYEEDTTSGGELTLASRPVSFKLQSWPYGQPDSSEFERLATAVETTGLQLDKPGKSPALQGQVLWWAAPADFSSEEEDLLHRHLEAGGTVLMSADWGGASGTRPNRLQEVLRRVGAYTRVDLVRTASGQASLQPLWHPPFQDVGLGMEGACTVQAAPPAVTLATLPEGGFRVASVDARPNALAVSRTVGRGRLILLGDTHPLWPETLETAQQAARLLRQLVSRLG